MSKTWYAYTSMTNSADVARKLESHRDTESTIFYIDNAGKERRRKKHNSWETWVDSVEELERLIAAANEREKARRYDMSVRRAAPDLLEALEAVVRVADRDTVEFRMARAAIAKAKGDQE